MKHQINHSSNNSKQGFRANGSILPLALRPGLAILFILLSISGTFVISSLNHPSFVSATSITLSIPNSLSLDISGASPSGTFAKSSPATVSTKTDSKTGYTLSIKSKESVDSNCLKNGDDKINSISSNMTEDQFKTSAPMNTWGYQPDKFNSITNSNFLPGPTDTESIIDKTKTANNVLGSNYNIVLAAKINSELPAGTYKNTYTLTATANAVTYSVHYNNLESSTGGPSPNPQTGQTEGNTVTLSDKAPTKDEFKFKGYCMIQPTEDGSCGTIVLQPGDTFALYCDENNIELYAIWEADPTMQSFSCNLLPSVGDSVIIKDSRDGTKYNVAKLADNKCWMTDNLKIANTTLHSSDSDVASDFTLPSSSASGFSGSDTSYVYIDATYGGYYSWFAATAGEGKESFSSGDTSHSICPKGWRLPTKTEYDSLVTAYSAGSNGKALQNAPANFKKGGLYHGSSPNYVSSLGLYWSSTAYNSSIAWYLRFNDLSAYIYNSSNKPLGLSVRCIARQ